MSSPPNWRSSVSTYDHELGSVGVQSRRVSALTSPDQPQYAEYDPNLGPQVFTTIPEEPETAPATATSTSSHVPSRDFAFVNDLAYERPRRRNCLVVTGNWIKRKPYLAMAAGAGLIGLICIIVLPVVIHKLSLNGDSSITEPTSTSGAPTSTSSSTTSSSSFHPSGIPPPPQCDSNNQVSKVQYLGIANSISGWQFKVLQAGDPANCCAQCYKAFTGCQGWAFIDVDNTNVPCNIIYDFKSSNADQTCPKGHASILLKTSDDAKYANSAGGPGPCGEVATTT